ncbi:MAG: hypothetical protein IKC09_10245, partial [Oscillospiraceae bacterium]|nr:hypothetical protein [Oscillospiraceae bacterium]
VIWAEDFGSEKVLKTAEYFVYCGVFKTHLWGERFAQSPKGEFLEVPSNQTILPGANGQCSGHHILFYRKKKFP